MGFFVVIVFIFSIFSFNLSLYWFFVQKTGVGLAYVVDQLFPFVIATIASLFVMRKNKTDLLHFIKLHRLYLISIAIIIFFVHQGILGFYFFSEDPTTILAAVTNNGDRLITLLRGYPFVVYVASFIMFGTNIWLYNLITFILFIIAAISIYSFIYVLLNKKFAAFVGALFFITTPSYLTMFIWQSNSGGMSLVLFSGILSLISLFYFQKTKNKGLYILSLLFFIAALKMGFGRAVGLIILPLFLFFLPINSKINFKKSVFLSLPYVIISFLILVIMFLIPDGFFHKIIQGQLANVTVRSEPLHFQNFFPAFSTWIAYLFLPNQIAGILYPLIKTTFGYNSSSLPITVIVGIFCITFLLILTTISILNLKKKYGKIILFATIWIFSNLFFVPLFVGDYHDTKTTDWYFTRIDPGSAPGTKYVFFSSVGICILISLLTLFLQKRNKRMLLVWIIFLLGLISSYIVMSNKFYVDVLKETPQKRVIPDKVFELVPKDGKKKILFSTNPIKNAIDNQTGTYGEKWLNSFYPYSELFYTNDFSLVEKLIKEGKYKKENVYAFYNNPVSLTFKDVSGLARKELFIASNKQEEIVEIARDTNDPFVLENKLFVSIDLNIRFLFPRKIAINTNMTIDYGEIPLTIQYACAEEKDWDIQKEDFSEPVPNIWKEEKSSISNLHAFQELTFPIDCYGSVLKKVVLLGPAYPINITLKRITLK